MFLQALFLICIANGMFRKKIYYLQCSHNDQKKNNNDVRISNTAVTMVTLQGESFTANNTLDEVSLLLLQWNDC